MIKILLTLMMVLGLVNFCYAENSPCPEPVSALDTIPSAWAIPIWSDISADVLYDGNWTVGVGTNLVSYKDTLFLRAEAGGNTDDNQDFFEDGRVGLGVVADPKKVFELSGLPWLPQWTPHLGVIAMTQTTDRFMKDFRVTGYLKVIKLETLYSGVKKIFSK